MDFSDEEWFDSVLDFLPGCSVFDEIVELENSEAKRKKRTYQSHNRTKNLWSTAWGINLESTQFM